MRRIVFALASLLSLVGAGAQEAYKPDVFYYQRSSLFEILPVDTTDIVMLGNSLTNGGEWHELLGMPNVKNRGISSDVIDGVRMRLRPLVAGRPAKIFLMIGVNDISHDLTADSVATAYIDLIREIRSSMPDTRLYVQSCLPVNISFGRYKKMADKEQTIRDVNALVADAAPTEGFTYIDLYSRFVDADGHMRRELTNDGLHLLGEGYLVWRDAIMPYVTE